MRTVAWLVAVILIAGAASVARADVTVETVVDGLNNPAGVAIQPETGVIFVSDSGAGRVVRIVDGKVEDVIVQFPKDVYGKGPMYDIGPLGLAFLDKDTLVVGGGDLPDGQEMLRVFTLPEPGKGPLKADDMKASFRLEATDDLKGEGNFYGLAATANGVYVTSNGDDTKGWVAKLAVNGSELGPYTRFIATKEATGVDAPVGITISPRGEIVIGQMGEITVPGDSLLTFYNANNGKMLSNFETGLNDITAVTYGPSGQLYATDFSWIDTAEGGLFHLVSKRDTDTPGVVAQKVVGLDKPTAMVFAADGTLYITVIGTATETNKTPGKLVKIAPGL